VSHVRQTYPFEIDAWVTLPDHIHALCAPQL
jgi:REP element-mobilizing transposase RayT